MSQEQLGLLLRPGLKRGTISAIESARQRVMAHLIAQFSEVLDVEPGFFFPKRLGADAPDVQLNQFTLEVEQNIMAALAGPPGVRGKR